MKQIPNSVFNQFETVAKRVLTNLKTRGHIVPIQHNDGTLHYEKFVVAKNKDGLYTVKSKNIVYYNNINLQQTAAVVANDLALGKFVDNNLLILDRDYGFKLFEEELYQQAAKRKKNNIDQVIFYNTRKQIARSHKEEIKNRILKSFKKLINIA
jgi:hypothetical protein